MTERAIELLNLPEKSGLLLLDIGCGSGISGEVIAENEHLFIGLDISRDMLSFLDYNILFYIFYFGKIINKIRFHLSCCQNNIFFCFCFIKL